MRGAANYTVRRLRLQAAPAGYGPPLQAFRQMLTTLR
jgi:hypothetical protein